jgi:hypothetical protein
MDSSNTASNSKKVRGAPFAKGDPRINRKGRPKSFDALRELALQIAHEEAKAKGGGSLVIDGHIVTTAEAILRNWAISNNPILQKAFMEYAFGKVPERQEVTGKDGGDLTIRIVDETDHAHD